MRSQKLVCARARGSFRSYALRRRNAPSLHITSPSACTTTHHTPHIRFIRSYRQYARAPINSRTDSTAHMSSASEDRPPAAPDAAQQPRPHAVTSSSFFTYPVSYAVSGLLRRLSTDPVPQKPPASIPQPSDSSSIMAGVYTPPRRNGSPFQPPPLTPLALQGYEVSTRDSAKLLSRQLAEEIRLLVPPRLQLVDEWKLAYSLEQNGVSLATLYKSCEEYRGKRGGFVLVVRDSGGGVRPHPQPATPTIFLFLSDNGRLTERR